MSLSSEGQVYQQNKFCRHISIDSWDITTSIFEKQTSAILCLFMTSWPTNWVNWVTTFIDRWQLFTLWTCRQLDVELSRVELCRYKPPLNVCVWCVWVYLVCKVKVHKRCAVMASSLSCKWTTLASVGDEIIEEDSGVRWTVFITPPWLAKWCDEYCLSIALWLTVASDNKREPNMVDVAEGGDPLELINCRRWSGFGYGL